MIASGGFVLMTMAALGADPVPFGSTPDGRQAVLHTLDNGKGLTAKVSTLGATLVELNVPDRDGKAANVVLGFDDAAGYAGPDNQFFGCTTGRVANRIAKGRFTLDGNEYRLAINNEPNHLHGGVAKSLDKLVWTATPIASKEGPSLRLTVTSPAGDEGYPGTLAVTVTYTLTDANALRIDYRAETDARTPVNLTNHSYFNLAGAGAPTVLDHELTLDADKYTATDDTLIPTGKLDEVAGTPLDFRTPHRLGARLAEVDGTPAKGYDHNFVLRPRGPEPTFAARLRDPASGRTMTVSTTQPGLQVYTGNFLKGQKGRGGKTYAHRSAICLETQHFPDSVNRPEFPTTIVEPGTPYRHATLFAFAAQ